MENCRQLDPDIISQISGYVRVGADFFLATAACGVRESVAKEWLAMAEKAGEEEESIYGELFRAIKASEAQAEVIALQRLSAEGGSAGAKWLLEKMRPEKYGKLAESTPSRRPPEACLSKKGTGSAESVIDWDNL